MPVTRTRLFHSGRVNELQFHLGRLAVRGGIKSDWITFRGRLVLKTVNLSSSKFETRRPLTINEEFRGVRLSPWYPRRNKVARDGDHMLNDGSLLQDYPCPLHGSGGGFDHALDARYAGLLGLAHGKDYGLRGYATLHVGNHCTEVMVPHGVESLYYCWLV